jgi:hypothetical protein
LLGFFAWLCPAWLCSHYYLYHISYIPCLHSFITWYSPSSLDIYLVKFIQVLVKLNQTDH